MNSVFVRSLGFPPRVGADGRFGWSAGQAHISESITVVLKTDPGERVGVPDFGAGLGRFLFEPNNAATHARIQDAILRALTSWERRIQVESIDIAAAADDAENALATITYRLVATDARERISLNIPIAAA